MAELNDDQKLEIVTQLAQLVRYADIARAVSEEFGVAVDRFQVRSYDPTKPSYRAGPKWSDMFHALRKAHLHDVASKPVANQGYRLALLQQQIEALLAERPVNRAMLLQYIEAAAKEMGGIHTNTRNQHHSGSVTREPLSREDALAELTMRVQAAKERIAADKQAEACTREQTSH